MRTLRIQIADYDTYQCPVLHLDQLQDEVARVPVIRVYGLIVVPGDAAGSTSASASSTPASTLASTPATPASPESSSTYNVVAHVHNYFPYVLVDCWETRPECARMTHHLEALMRRTVRARRRRRDRDPNDEEDSESDEEETAAGRRLYIARVALCKATPAYGFHLGHRLVYKISLLSALYKTTLVRLLNEDKVDWSGTRLRARSVYEGHIPGLLQFATDFNLFGCSWMEVSACHWRVPVFHRQYAADAARLGALQRHLAQHYARHVLAAPRTAHCLLECDVQTHAICNRRAVEVRNLHATLRPAAPRQQFLMSLNLLARDIRYQAETRGGAFDASSQLNRTSETGGGGTAWLNQAELDELLQYVCAGAAQSYERISAGAGGDPRVPTAFELVDVEANGGGEGEDWGGEDVWWGEALAPSSGAGAARAAGAVGIEGDQVCKAGRRGADGAESAEGSEGSEGAMDAEDAEDALDNVDDSFSDSEAPEDARTASSPVGSPGPAATSAGVSSPAAVPGSSPEAVAASSPARSPARSPTRSPAALVPSDHALLTQVPRTQPPPQATPPPRKRAREDPRRFRGYEAPPPPSPAALADAFAQASLPQVDYPDPHYDSTADRPARPLVFANRKIVVPCELAEAPPPWTAPYAVSGEMRTHIEASLRDRRVRIELFKTKRVRPPPAPTQWRYVAPPPSPRLVARWAAEEPHRRAKAAAFVSQLERFTATNDFKFSNRPDKVARKPDGFSHLTTFNLEVHPLTWGELAPDPSRDAVGLVVYCFDDPNAGVQRRGCLRGDAALDEVVRLVRYCDPDILCGYEVIAASWGYLVARARHLDRNLCHELSRSDFKSNGKVGDRWGYTHTSNVEVPGRHMLNVWRVLRSELSLTSYSLEHVAYHLLHQVVPRFGVGELTEWLTGTAGAAGAAPQGEDGGVAAAQSMDAAGQAPGVAAATGAASSASAAFGTAGGAGPLASAVTTYYLKRLDLTAQLMAAQEIILRYSEQSRLIGVDFYSNFYRGLQYKVELLLLRLAKAQNVLLNSPSKDHVHNMRLLECIPLVMEPALGFYKLPLVVVDFQALYPSIIIAYNYCYTTMLGRLRGYDARRNEVGYLRHVAMPRGLLAALHAHNDITVSPNGVMFARLRVRKSMLAQMLEEILAARINVKRLMRMFGAHDAELRKLYDSKQMALKLIANVTYGYTSASFSGRMPNLDVADAIVATGREILTQLIGLIERHPQWGARVVYGDTDLLFVYLPGRQRDEAFRIGRQIAEHVTGHFPNPVALKFEKVYHPCVLLSKKRYVGYSYELETAAAKFDAKGIETVRRDGIPAQQIVLERLLRLLFDTANLLAVKRYVVQQFGKVAAGRVSVRDFCFAKEVRLGSYKDARYMPPGAVLAQRAADHDPRAEPQYRERVPYVVVQDSLKPRLRDRCVLPQDYAAALRLAAPYKLDHVYYILKMLVPPLERIFNLMGVDVRAWFREMPRAAPGAGASGGGGGGGGVFGAHIRAHACAVCHRQLDGGGPVCAACGADEQAVVASLCGAVRTAAAQHAQTLATCRGCASAFCGPLGRALHAVLQCCDNYNCKTYYERLKATQTKARVVAATLDLLDRW